jgi:hypothetical protein
MENIKRKIEEDDDKLIRAIVGIEQGSAGEFEHLQADLAFENHYTGWEMKRIWSQRAHWEKAKGTPKQNYDYCSKEQNILAVKGFEKILERIAKEKDKTNTG